MTISIYHNPRCSKSRQTLALLEAEGVAPDVILYLENPPSQKVLKEIIASLGISPRALIRKKEAPYKDLRLGEPSVTDADLIKAMADHPILIERPIVVNGVRAAIGRPPENVLDIL